MLVEVVLPPWQIRVGVVQQMCRVVVRPLVAVREPEGEE
jgi:hypothetical protein